MDNSAKKLFEQIIIHELAIDLINSYPTDSKKGYAFECLWHIIIIFGFCSYFNQKKIKFYSGSINKNFPQDLKEITNLKTFLEKRKIYGGGTGASDITIKIFDEIHQEWQWLIISCKLFNDEKNIENYGIHYMNSVMNSNAKFKIGMCIRDSDKVKSKLMRATSLNEEIIHKIDFNCIFGFSYLEQCYSLFRNHLINNNIHFENIDEKISINKKRLIPKLHFIYYMKKFMKKIEDITQLDFLIAWKCRSGKTYFIAFLLYEFYIKYGHLNALIIIPNPNETRSQFVDEIFNVLIEFQNINIIEIKNGEDIHSAIFKENNIIIVSKQILDRNKLHFNEIFDFIIFDEAHFHGTTYKSETILKLYSKSEYTIRIYCTATFNKPLFKYIIPPDNRYYWDMNDENNCKERNIETLVNKFGEDFITNVSKEQLEHYLSMYDNMPTLITLTPLVDNERMKKIWENIQNSPYGYSMDALFKTEKSIDKNDYFEYKDAIISFLEYICGQTTCDQPMKIIPDNDCVFHRINFLSDFYGSRTKLNNIDFSSQIWFLPQKGIGIKSMLLKELMLNHRILCEYAVLMINSSPYSDQIGSNVKSYIEHQEEKAKNEGKRGLIILAGARLILGISLPHVDITMILNDTMSADKYFQMICRAGTEDVSSRINTGLKRVYFTFDPNECRSLKINSQYHEVNKNSLSHRQQIKIIANLINMDYDKRINVNSNDYIDNLYKKWKESNCNFEEKIFIFPDYEYKNNEKLNEFIRKYSFCYTKRKMNKKEEEKEKEVQINNGYDPTIHFNNGITRHVLVLSSKEQHQENMISYRMAQNILKEILNSITYIICFYTYDLVDISTSLLERIEFIKEEKTLCDMVNHEFYTRWRIEISNNDFLNDFVSIYENNKEIFSFIENITEMAVQELIDSNECTKLEWFNKYLIPSENEKKQYGEVFTPLSLVNEMLDKLPIEVWNNPNLKWFDPANGMGNFTFCVYERLMKSLSEHIPNEFQRKKHILENMLYVSEINSRNNDRYSKIMNPNGHYMLNINEGNTLELVIKEKWNIDAFDIVLGNPPYNDGSGNKGKGHTLWTKFIEKSLDIWVINNGYLLYVNPSLWRQVDHPLQKKMKQYQIEYLEIHNEKDGLNTFKCNTRYDWYLIKKIKYSKSTIIKNQRGEIIEKDISKMSFIPNFNFDLIDRLTNKTDKVNILYSRSDYASDKKWISKIKEGNFIYPVVYSVNKKNEPKFLWSKINTTNGHYGNFKIIFGSGATGFVIDSEGKYACCEYCTGIIDKIENLHIIADVLNSKQFKNEIILAISVSKAEINRKILKVFNKDFWREFI